MTPSSNPVGWFEIPVTDMDRAIRFYEEVFQVKLEKHDMGPLQMAWFPSVGDNVRGSAGSLVKHKDWYKPSSFDGVVIYFTAQSGDVANELARAIKAGGQLAQGKKSIGEYGFVAFFIDSEGNRIGLHCRT